MFNFNMKLQYIFCFAILSTLLLPMTNSNIYAVIELDTTVDIEAGSADANSGKSYDPKDLTIGKGTRVTWINQDNQGHTVTSGSPGDTDFGSLFDSTTDPSGFLIKPGAKWEHTFDTVGEFPYFCQIHPWMTGKVIVMEKVETITPTEPEKEFSPPLEALTEDGDIKVRVSWSPVMVEPGIPVEFKIETLDPETNGPTSSKLYDSMLFDPDGKHVDASHRSLQIKDIQTYTFNKTGAFTLRLENVNNTGQAVTFSVMVVPEFPIAAVATLMAITFAAAIFVTRKFRSIMRTY
jgi:plastocyanin